MNAIRSISLVLVLLVSVTTVAQVPQLTKLWETDSTLKIPESVLFHAEGQMLYVSNIDGKSNEKDLKGSISKVNLNGKIVDQNWAVNLSAPKGMGIFKNTLFVTDIDEVVSIDLKSAKVLRRLPVSGAVFLNDLTIDNAGVMYVSDSRTGKVHRIEGDKVSIHIENKMGVNGLLASGENLFLVAKDTLWRADKAKKLTRLAIGMDESSDGIAQTTDGDLIVSCWNGIIYLISADGNKTVLLDTRKEKSNTADIGFDPKKNIIYVPTFLKNKVVAYQLSNKGL